MKEIKTDPRILRTRKLIIDSFITLSTKKSFESISVKDITDEALINRATFYNHFLDKYDLLEQVVEERLSLNLNCSSKPSMLSIEETLLQIFQALVSFYKSLNIYSDKQDDTKTIESIIQLELTRVFFNMLTEHGIGDDDSEKHKLSSLMTHAIIGMNADYMRLSPKASPDDYLKPLLPFILNGVQS